TADVRYFEFRNRWNAHAQGCTARVRHFEFRALTGMAADVAYTYADIATSGTSNSAHSPVRSVPRLCCWPDAMKAEASFP
ncbi:MAG TPA: hypothetical protein VHC69_16695, partial [Polyangiaceae bacterium]|nr:hypothetical protein [Polyangiaceae bacterium]